MLQMYPHGSKYLNMGYLLKTYMMTLDIIGTLHTLLHYGILGPEGS